MNQSQALHKQTRWMHIRVGVFERTVVVRCIDFVEEPALFFSRNSWEDVNTRHMVHRNEAAANNCFLR